MADLEGMMIGRLEERGGMESEGTMATAAAAGEGVSEEALQEALEAKARLERQLAESQARCAEMEDAAREVAESIAGAGESAAREEEFPTRNEVLEARLVKADQREARLRRSLEVIYCRRERFVVLVVVIFSFFKFRHMPVLIFFVSKRFLPLAL